MEKFLDYYLSLNWTLIEGEDLDFEGNVYHYIMIEEIPGFCYCAKTLQNARTNYKHQLKLVLQVMLENNDEIPEPKGVRDDTDWESVCP